MTNALAFCAHHVHIQATTSISMETSCNLVPKQSVWWTQPTSTTHSLVNWTELFLSRVGVTLTTLGDGNILIMGGNQQVTLLAGQIDMVQFVPLAPASWHVPHSRVTCQSHRLLC